MKLFKLLSKKLTRACALFIVSGFFLTPQVLCMKKPKYKEKYKELCKKTNQPTMHVQEEPWLELEDLEDNFSAILQESSEQKNSAQAIQEINQIAERINVLDKKYDSQLCKNFFADALFDALKSYASSKVFHYLLGKQVPLNICVYTAKKDLTLNLNNDNFCSVKNASLLHAFILYKNYYFHLVNPRKKDFDLIQKTLEKHINLDKKCTVTFYNNPNTTKKNVTYKQLDSILNEQLKLIDILVLGFKEHNFEKIKACIYNFNQKNNPSSLSTPSLYDKFFFLALKYQIPKKLFLRLLDEIPGFSSRLTYDLQIIIQEHEGGDIKCIALKKPSILHALNYYTFCTDLSWMFKEMSKELTVSYTPCKIYTSKPTEDQKNSNEYKYYDDVQKWILEWNEQPKKTNIDKINLDEECCCVFYKTCEVPISSRICTTNTEEGAITTDLDCHNLFYDEIPLALYSFICNEKVILDP